MKRYWKLFTLILIIILTIGVFYLKPIISKDEYPDFTIRTLKGNPIEIDKLILQGSYSPDAQFQEEFGAMYSDKAFSLVKNKTLYNKKQPYFKQLLAMDNVPSINRLIKEHKSFLRGKNLQPQNFFEDDSFLIYATIDYSSKKKLFDVSILNKKTDEQLNYKINFPTKKDFQFIDIQKIQIINSNLSIVTRNDYSHMNQENYYENLQEYHVYQLDLGTQTVTTDHLIQFNTDSTIHDLSRIELLSETKINQSSNDLIFSLSYDQAFDQENKTESLNSYPETLGNELFYYTITTNKTKKINLPKEYITLDSTIILDKKNIYSYHFTPDNKINLYMTSLTNLNNSSKKEIDLSISEDSIEWQTIKNNKLYLVSRNKKYPIKNQLFVYNLVEDKLIYEGSIEPLSDNIQTKKNGLRIDYGLID